MNTLNKVNEDLTKVLNNYKVLCRSLEFMVSKIEKAGIKLFEPSVLTQGCINQEFNNIVDPEDYSHSISLTWSIKKDLKQKEAQKLYTRIQIFSEYIYIIARTRKEDHLGETIYKKSIIVEEGINLPADFEAILKTYNSNLYA